MPWIPQISAIAWLALAGGSVFGAALRFYAGWLLQSWQAWPYAVFVVNLVGSFGLALAMSWQSGQPHWTASDSVWRLMIAVGFFGSLTTFSTFSLDLLWFLQRGALAMGALYAVGSVLGGLALAWLGWQIGLGLR